MKTDFTRTADGRIQRPRMIARITQYLNDTNAVLIKTINNSIGSSSYPLKHIIERDIGEYVSEDELILGAIAYGATTKQINPPSIGCRFNFSQKWINTIRTSAENKQKQGQKVIYNFED